MQKGDIFWAENKKKHPHPIVFLEWIDSDSFKACILSTKPTNDNIPMLKTHFYETDQKGRRYTIQFSNNYLVPDVYFIKMASWLKSQVAQGRLTKAGVEFIESNVKNVLVLFQDPISKFKAGK